MKDQQFRSLVVGLVAGVFLAACGSGGKTIDTLVVQPDNTETSDPTGLACVVIDTSGAPEISLNQLANGGLLRATKELGVTTDTLESVTDADATSNFQSFVDKGCSVIIAVGAVLADAVKVAAEANPDVQYAIVDSQSTASNMHGVIFAADQPSFLAGYMAAASTKSGIVATFGEARNASVMSSMTGFVRGVDYYNAQKGAQIRVLGWSVVEQDGVFVGATNDLSSGESLSKDFVDKGADIIFPVAGVAGLGSSAVAMQSAGKLKVIGFAVDMSESNPTHKSVYLGSVLKRVDVAVIGAVDTALKGEGGGVDYLGTLSNGGVDFMIFSVITKELQAELDVVRSGIMDGSITW